MEKIPTLYLRDPATNLRYVHNEVHPDCRWVIDGEGIATYKWDGTAVRIDNNGAMWKRRQVKPGAPTPHGWEQTGDPDPNTGKRVGWIPVQPDDRWHLEALWGLIDNWHDRTGNHWPDGAAGTYELVGPKVQGNPHRIHSHLLILHERGGGRCFDDDEGTWAPPPTEFNALGRWLHEFSGQGVVAALGFEGIVWHHPDGRMAKIKAADFPQDQE